MFTKLCCILIIFSCFTVLFFLGFYEYFFFCRFFAHYFLGFKNSPRQTPWHILRSFKENWLCFWSQVTNSELSSQFTALLSSCFFTWTLLCRLLSLLSASFNIPFLFVILYALSVLEHFLQIYHFRHNAGGPILAQNLKPKALYSKITTVKGKKTTRLKNV